MHIVGLLCLFAGVAYGRVLPLKNSPSFIDRVPLVINGEDADVGEWPWQCALLNFGGFSCGCTILDNTHILTAAHCTFGADPAFITFMVGAHDLYTQSEGNPTEISSVEIAIHPDYFYNFVDAPEFDVSVVTTESITYDDYIQPIPELAPSGSGDNYVGQECYITGWGDTYDYGLPDILQEAQIRVLTLADCQERYSTTPYVVGDESVCMFKLNDSDDHTGACYGDSGGPLVCRESSTSSFVQVGVTSWGYPPCGIDGSEDGLPMVYMHVGDPSHRDFIDGVVN